MAKRFIVGAACAALASFLVGLAPGWAGTRPEPDALVPARPVPEPGGSLTLEQALAFAASHDPRLRGSAWSVRAATARRGDAGRLSNPTISFEIENVGGGTGSDASEATLTLGQTLELGGDRGARARVAEALEQVARAGFTSEERTVLEEVSERFLESWELQERVAHLAEAERLAERFVEAAAERHRAGAGPAMERARAGAVLGLRRSERLRAAAGLAAGRQRLAASWGSAVAGFDSLLLAPPRMDPVPAAEDLDALLNDHPERRRATAAVALEEARLREARAARVPDLDVGVGVRRLRSEGTTTFLAGVSVPVPLWNSRSGDLAAAEAVRQVARAHAGRADVDLRARLREARERYVAAAGAYDLVVSQVVPRNQEVLAQVTAGYRAGRWTSLDYIEAERSLLDARILLVEATADAWRARLALERLVGRPLAGIGKDGGE